MLQFAIFVMVTGAYAQVFNVTDFIIPERVFPSQNEVEMECRYQGNFTLLNWFKGSNEFFRYKPGAAPSTRSFPIVGVGRVELVFCGPTICRLKLGSLTEKATGLYRCDIERDVVPYKFASKSGYMKILGFEHRKPLVEGLAAEFSEGDEMRAYCRAENNTEIRWYLNGQELEEFRGSSAFRYKSSRPKFKGLPPTVIIQCAEVIDGRLIGSIGSSAIWVETLSKYGDDTAQKQKSKASHSTSNKIIPLVVGKYLFFLCILIAI